MEEKKGMSDYIKYAIVLLFMFGFRYVPPIAPMTPYGMGVLGVLIGAILGWSFDSKQMLGTSSSGSRKPSTDYTYHKYRQDSHSSPEQPNRLRMCPASV